jgi:hypothetical protein
MYKYSFKEYLTGMFAVVLIFFGQISVTQAALITNEQIEEQKKEVLLGIVTTLEEHVKFLQMILIQNLEARVEYLQTLADNK